MKTLSARTTDKRKISEFLKSHPIATLGTIDELGNPHITIVYFSINDKMEISFTTKRQTKKNYNILRSNQVMLLTYEATSQTSASITGRAEEIWDVIEAGEIFRDTLNSSLKTSGIGIPPVAKLYGDYVAYRIKPDQIRMIEYSRANPSNYQLYDSPLIEISFK